jgi:hypothetical protein
VNELEKDTTILIFFVMVFLCSLMGYIATHIFALAIGGILVSCFGLLFVGAFRALGN